MKRRLCEHEVLHADETTLQVLHEDGKPAQSKSYMWLYRTSGEAKHQIVLYDYQPNRKLKSRSFLRNFKGYLHADGYDGYHRLPDNITVGVLGTRPTKFDELLQTIPKDKRYSSDAAKGIAYCDKLFRLEKQFALLIPENRHKERERLSKPLMDEFLPMARLSPRAAEIVDGVRQYITRSHSESILNAIFLTGGLRSATTAPKERFARL